jgi:RimJ/RimL family protein N-acetyltransferase
MILLTPNQTATLRSWFVPDRPGPLVGLHIIHTGNGACFVDRWPNPRAVLVETAGNYSLTGDPTVLKPDDLKHRIFGFVEAPERFVPLLQATFSSLRMWDRVILDLQVRPRFAQPRGYLVRRLGPTDTYQLWGLSPKAGWIWKTWSSPSGLASSGYAWGTFVDGRLVSVACTFFVGERYEEIGVVTEPEFRGLGLSVACAGALCEEIQARGRRPSWSTSPDNTASLRVAEKLGFSVRRRDRLYVIGIPIPEPARRQVS